MFRLELGPDYPDIRLVVEPDETFFVNLSNPVGATILDGQGHGTIINDDASAPPTINVVAQAEGNSGTTNFVFTVTISATANATVNFATKKIKGLHENDFIMAAKTNELHGA